MERRRKAPASLQLSRSQEEAEPGVSPAASRAPLSPTRFKVKTKSSPLIERLQANLALSPTALLPPPAPLSPSSEEEEAAAGFGSPPGGAPLPSFNKTRARLSFKRRLPSRKHRRSSGEESPLEDGEQGAGFHSPEEEEEEERDCEPSEKKLEETSQGLMEEEGGGEGAMLPRVSEGSTAPLLQA
ncbi:capZ-interacting protein [Synchiropus splendidus]|uniref:capZ-interacting protein n=1 Tax=Synchiropus splendidus TaxID=270530 RepID=UPI00237EE19C|nr:capZ-interacting protein [Synchiropus splendidus]